MPVSSYPVHVIRAYPFGVFSETRLYDRCRQPVLQTLAGPATGSIQVT